MPEEPPEGTKLPVPFPGTPDFRVMVNMSSPAGVTIEGWPAEGPEIGGKEPKITCVRPSLKKTGSVIGSENGPATLELVVVKVATPVNVDIIPPFRRP
ncbi:MAG: hypothetical protein ABSA78_12080 [Candidatus Sulfotelmatobacter sp.]